MIDGKALLQKYRHRIDTITPPDAIDCRNLLTGRVMHFCAEEGNSLLTEDEKLAIAEAALQEEQMQEGARSRFFRK
ncbi:MAG: hypothetical protein ACOY3M_02905 [Patescibacteria group bacterium]